MIDEWWKMREFEKPYAPIKLTHWHNFSYGIKEIEISEESFQNKKKIERETRKTCQLSHTSSRGEKGKVCFLSHILRRRGRESLFPPVYPQNEKMGEGDFDEQLKSRWMEQIYRVEHFPLTIYPYNMRGLFVWKANGRTLTSLGVFKSKPIQNKTVNRSKKIKNRKKTKYFWMCLDVVLEKPLWSDRISDHLFKTEPNRNEPQK